MGRRTAQLTRWITDVPSTRVWAVRFGLANLLSVFLTTALVSLFLNAKTPAGKIFTLAGAILVAGGAAYLLAQATSLREARFPKYPDIVLAMTRALSRAIRQESSQQPALSPDAIKRSSIDDLKSYLRALEDVLAISWSRRRFGEQTTLEVVLMNRAADGYVTVAVWANNRPLSLDRRDRDPQFYEKTEAAKLFREFGDNGVRAPIHIISDVSKYSGYDHFGRDSSLRTNSTALFPIYDSDSRLHGFIAVTARERTGLFREEDRAFWSEVWEMWEPHLLRHILRYESLADGSPMIETRS